MQIRGFTLIELMIALAIIGVLAVIAHSQYENHIVRVQVSEAVSLSTAYRAEVEAAYAVGRSFTPDEWEPASGKYVSHLGWDSNLGYNGCIAASFGVNAHAKLQDAGFLLCVGKPGTTVEERAVPNPDASSPDQWDWRCMVYVGTSRRPDLTPSGCL